MIQVLNQQVAGGHTNSRGSKNTMSQISLQQGSDRGRRIRSKLFTRPNSAKFRQRENMITRSKT